MEFFVKSINFTIFAIFVVSYGYQMIYTLVSIFIKNREFAADKLCRYAIFIAARNERAVIAQLIDSVKKQRYPAELIDVYVIADNCTDDTARVARDAGAVVFERFNRDKVGKGYALNYGFHALWALENAPDYDGYFVFDADNLIDENYVTEMNKVFCSGYKVITSYRNTKNFDDNWVSSAASLWFIRESRYINSARMALGVGCAISGTGYLVSSELIKSQDGWRYYLLTEDIEFSVDAAINEIKIGYCPNAILYDEQPTSFKQSWDQRLRWAKGFYQILAKYGARLIKGIFKRRSFTCYDMFMCAAPGIFVMFAGVVINLVLFIIGICKASVMPNLLAQTATAFFISLFNYYGTLLLFSGLTMLTEWKLIRGTPTKKILYLFTTPIYHLSYVLITICALFKKVTWKPIKHTVSKSIEEFNDN